MLMKAAVFEKKDIELSVLGFFPQESSHSDILNVFTANEKVMKVLTEGESYNLDVRDIFILSSLYPEWSEDFDISQVVLH